MLGWFRHKVQVPSEAPPQAPSKSIARDLGSIGQSFSDAATLMLEGMAIGNMRVAADAAAGYADAAERFTVNQSRRIRIAVLFTRRID